MILYADLKTRLRQASSAHPHSFTFGAAADCVCEEVVEHLPQFPFIGDDCWKVWFGDAINLHAPLLRQPLNRHTGVIQYIAQRELMQEEF